MDLLNALRAAAARLRHGRPRLVATKPTSATSLPDWAGPLPRQLETTWNPQPDGAPNPGEVVWAWVPFEEDAMQGKDRPVLILGAHPDRPDVMLALQLTSKDHDRDAAQEARAGRLWMDVGAGDWDSRHRPSEVRLNRVLQLRTDAMRREGAALDRETYETVVHATRQAMA